MRKPRLYAEPLDRRDCPALFGNPWLDPNLTLSFVPDGLGSLLPGQPAGTVSREVLRAFQTWINAADVNVGLVADGGQPVGTAGASLNDPRFGDIRVAAGPLAADDVALALPYDVSAGTRAGDLTFNTAKTFAVGSAQTYDLYSVALHEAGHVFGLAGSADPASAMYQIADRVRTGLSAADAQGVQQLYGPRAADAFEGQTGNGTIPHAARLQPNSSNGSNRITATADLTTADDVDVYSFKADHLDGGAYLFDLKAAGLSLIVPTVDILDGNGNVLATGTGAAVGAGDVSLRLTALKEGDTYYARVRSTDPTFAVGGYRLDLRPANDRSETRLTDPEAGANDSATASTSLSRLPAQAGTRQNFAAAASLSTAADVDFYRVRTAQRADDSPAVLTVSVVATGADGLDPVVQVFDRNQVLQATTVLVHDAGEFSVQLPAAEENRDYFIAVRHAAGNAAVGNYSLGIDYGGPVVPLQEIATGILTTAAPAATSTLTVPVGQVLHLILTADATPTPAAVRASVFDAAGVVIDTRLAPAGGSASLNAFLPAGTYHLLVGGGGADGNPMPTIAYTVRGLTVSDPIGPQAIDNIGTRPPVVSPPTAPPPPPPPAVSPPRPVTPTTPVTPTDPNILLVPPTEQPTSPTLQLRPVSPPPAKTLSVGLTSAAGSSVRSFDADGGVRFSVVPLPGYTGPLRTAEADFNNDGVADVLVGTGPGAASQVRLIDGASQAVLFSLAPFEASFTGGLFVAAGDVTGDGVADVVLTPDEGGGPRVRVFAGGGFAPVADFFGIDDPAFRGGARAAVGDVDGDGTGDVVVSAGFQGGPRLAGFSGAELAKGNVVKVFADFFAFEQTLRNGTFVAVGDLDGDGKGEVIVGGGPGGGPRVTAFGGADLLANRYSVVGNFFAGDPAARDGVRVAVKTLDADGRADVVVGVGRRVIGYSGAAIPGGSLQVLFDQDVPPGLTDAVYVG